MAIHTISPNYTQKLDQNLDHESAKNLDSLNKKLDQKPLRNAIKFTDRKIKSLKSNNSRIIYWCEGMKEFGIRITPKGTKTWIYEYRFNNKTRRMSLGHYPRVSLSKATKLYSEASIKVLHGVDPLAERTTTTRQENEALSVSDLSKKYIQYCIVKGEVSWQEKQRAINKELLPIIGHLKAKDITFRDIAPIINTLNVDRNTPVQAQRLLSHVRCMFRYAKNSLGIVEINPCADLQAPKRTPKRKRALSAKEIYQFWYNIDYAYNMSDVVRLGLKFMLCTLARGVEVRKMKWRDVNFADKTWLIPAENAKNNNELLLPLNRYAIQVLQQVKELTGHSEFAFGYHSSMSNKIFGKNYDLSIMGGTAFSHALRDNFELLNIEEKFTPHDLRKTGATCLTTVSYPKEWGSKLLNHKPTDITSMAYDVFDYFEEKRAGMESIQFILTRILNVQSVDDVPSLRSLRREFLSKKLIYLFLDERYYTSKPCQNTVQDFQSTSLAHSNDTLFYDHNGLD